MCITLPIFYINLVNVFSKLLNCSGDGLKLKNDEMKSVIKGLESQIVKEKEAKERLQRECADQWSQVARLKAEVSIN